MKKPIFLIILVGLLVACSSNKASSSSFSSSELIDTSEDGFSTSLIDSVFTLQQVTDNLDFHTPEQKEFFEKIKNLNLINSKMPQNLLKVWG